MGGGGWEGEEVRGGVGRVGGGPGRRKERARGKNRNPIIEIIEIMQTIEITEMEHNSIVSIISIIWWLKQLK